MNHVEPWVVRGCRRWSPTQALPLVGGADWGGASSHVLACVRAWCVRASCMCAYAQCPLAQAFDSAGTLLPPPLTRPGSLVNKPSESLN